MQQYSVFNLITIYSICTSWEIYTNSHFDISLYWEKSEKGHLLKTLLYCKQMLECQQRRGEKQIFAFMNSLL